MKAKFPMRTVMILMCILAGVTVANANPVVR